MFCVVLKQEADHNFFAHFTIYELDILILVQLNKY